MNQLIRRSHRVSVASFLELRDTARYGLGVFATEDIPAGTVLYDEADVPRRFYTRAEILAQTDTEYFQTFSYVIGTDTYYSGPRKDVEKDITNFMNHSCDPNAWFDQDSRMQARRTIKKGEEVTCDYATFESEISFHRGMKCECGAESCRGELTGREYRDPGFQKKYAGHLSSYLEELIKGPSFFNENLYVREGQMGPGVFALSAIPADTVLACYSGRIITGAELNNVSPEDMRYNFQIGEDLFQVPMSPIRELPDFINHSCSPNSGLSDSITIKSLRPIEPEEEITLDYGTFNSGKVTDISDNFQCLCGSPECRQQITSRDYLLPAVQQGLLPYFSPYLKKIVEAKH